MNFIVRIVLQLGIAVASAPENELLKSSREPRTLYKRRGPRNWTGDILLLLSNPKFFEEQVS